MRRAAFVQSRQVIRRFASVPSKPGPTTGVPASNPEAWRTDREKYKDLDSFPGGRQPPRDFRMGPYASTMVKDPETGKVYPRGKFFAHPRDDPVTFVVNCLIALTTVWTISQLSWGESFFERRKRVMREKIRQEYGLPKGWEHDIDDEEELALSDAEPIASAVEPVAR